MYQCHYLYQGCYDEKANHFLCLKDKIKWKISLKRPLSTRRRDRSGRFAVVYRCNKLWKGLSPGYAKEYCNMALIYKNRKILSILFHAMRGGSPNFHTSKNNRITTMIDWALWLISREVFELSHKAMKCSSIIKLHVTCKQLKTERCFLLLCF